MITMNRSILIFIPLLITVLVCGCIQNDTNENNDSDVELTEKTLIPGSATVFNDFTTINITQLSVRTGIKYYINEDNPQSGVQLQYIDGFQHITENTAGTFFRVRGNVKNIGEEKLENITISANFTDKNFTDLHIVKEDTIRSLPSSYTGLFEIYVQDTEEQFHKIAYVTLTITYE